MAASRPSDPAKDEAGDFAQFTQFARRVLSVPHSEIQRRSEAERQAKASAYPAPASGKTTR